MRYPFLLSRLESRPPQQRRKASIIKFYRHPLSGHSHRVELFLSLIGQPYELVDVDLLKGEQKSPDFLTLNPFGKVPVIIDVENGGAVISDSNAILVYLARQCADLSWYPDNPKVSADVQKWLSVAAGDINNGPATARLITVFGACPSPLKLGQVLLSIW